MAIIMINRRSFMKSTLVSVAGFPLIASNALTQEEKIQEKGGRKRKFIDRTLGKTGIKLPVISMGAMYAMEPALFRTALDSGINHLETAHMHMAGKNEEMIGEVIKGRPRDSYFISTKIPFPHNKFTGALAPEAKEETFLKMLDISLKRLGSDYVDFLCLHGGMSRQMVLHETVLNAMEKAKKDGKIRFAGVSTHRNEPAVIQACTDSKFYDFVMPAYNFKQKHYVEVRESIARAAQAGLAIVAMKVMGGTGAISDVLRPVNASAALKWVLQDPNVHTTIPGFTNFDQMNIDLSVMEDLTLTNSEKEYLQQEASLPGLYCQGCGYCVKQCIAKLPIPDLMRAYMYAYGYSNPLQAFSLLGELGTSIDPCKSCGSCSVKCSRNFNIREKISDVSRLVNVPVDFLS